MEWIRTYPRGGRCGIQRATRSWIIDHTCRPIEMDIDYRPVLQDLRDDTVVMEWDIAASAEDRARFAAACLESPGSVRVAPYRVYPVSTGLARSEWVHRALTLDGGQRWVIEGEAVCDWFGLGMTYLPLQLVRRCLAETSGPLGDTSISQWHHGAIAAPVPIDWNCRPVHLHYSVNDITPPILRAPWGNS